MFIPKPNTTFDELTTFLASSPSAEAIIAYHPSEALQARMSELLEKNRADNLLADEQIELYEFLRMNRFMSHLRANATQHLKSS